MHDIDLLDTIKSLIVKEQLGTQEEISQRLNQNGIETNQATISRILKKLGAIKTVDEQGRRCYRLPHELAPPPTTRSLTSLIIDISANESMIVIRTNPGSASLIARNVDFHRERLKILGTVAGDDTLFIAPKSTREIKKIQNDIRNFLLNYTD